jgi:hypothetical protein
MIGEAVATDDLPAGGERGDLARQMLRERGADRFHLRSSISRGSEGEVSLD